MKPRLPLLFLAACIALLLPAMRGFAQLPAGAGEIWQRAKEGWDYRWPRDHVSHEGFKTEWWYFTGNLRGTEGRRFGYQLTFFRQGVRPPDAPAVRSRFVVDDLKFGHFTMTDVTAKRFLFTQRLTRGAFGEGGFGDGDKEPRLAWLDEWSLRLDPDGSFRISAREPDRSLELHLVPEKRWVTHGANGISRKAEGDLHASHYYSGTRLRSTGQIAFQGKTHAVEGESWFDHEWASNQLAPGQVGWDWFSLQFADRTELMLYRLRRKGGAIDPASSGSFIAADGAVTHLRKEDMEVTATKMWKSAASGAEYPSAWRVRVPSLGLELEVTTPVADQELVLEPVTYWEGLVDAVGTRSGRAVNGHGYVELTGYAGEIVGLSSPAK